MKLKQPFFSIITVSYNSEKTIERTIKSVLAQTYKNFEYSIIDGKSTDGTLNIIKNYEKKFKGKLKYISEPDTGIYNAMNKGILMSSGRLIGIINSDDWYEKKALEIIYNNYEKQIDIYHGMLRYIENNSEKFILKVSSSQLNKGEMICHPTCFVNAEVYRKIGLYDEIYKSSADLDLFIKFYKSNCIFKGINEIISNFTMGGMSFNYSSIKESYLVMYKYGIITKKEFLLKRLFYLIKALLKI